MWAERGMHPDVGRVACMLGSMQAVAQELRAKQTRALHHHGMPFGAWCAIQGRRGLLQEPLGWQAPGPCTKRAVPEVW